MKRKSTGGSGRLIRINDEILKECAVILRADIKDPRISAMVTVTKVETTNDLAHAKVFVSIMGDDEQKKEVLEGLKNASGFIRRTIAERINLRVTPELKFLIDDTLDYSLKMAKLIEEANK